MKDDVIAQAKEVHRLSESICEMERRLGKKAFAECHTNPSESGHDGLCVVFTGIP